MTGTESSTGSVRVLLLEDSDSDSQLINRVLGNAGGITVYRVTTQADYEQALKSGTFDAVLSDYAISGYAGLQALEQCEVLAPETPFIFISAVAGESFATEAVRAGATDYVTMRDLARLPFVVSRAVEEARQRREKRRALAALEESEERFRVMADSAPALIWAVDPDGKFNFVNRRFETDFGTSADTIASGGWPSVVASEDMDGLQETLSRANEAREPFRAEFRVKDKAGATRWLRCEGNVRNAGGQFLGYTGCAVDITDIKLATEMLEAEVENRTRQLAEKDEALRQSQKMEAIGQLTGGIAHDFNNMLAGILGAAELVRKRVQEQRYEEVDRYVEAIVSSANRAAALTHRLLAFSRRQSLDLRSSDVNELIVSLEDLLHRTLGEEIALETRLADDLWPARTDVNQLESAVLNLAINARDAMPEGGRLTISTANVQVDKPASASLGLVAGDYVVVRVSDTGTGMSPEVLAKAFDPFFTTKPIGYGTGLGLSMIFGFAKQVGGHARIDSEPGKGTAVEIYMPRDQAGEEEAAQVEEIRAMKAAADETILVVEDEVIVQMLLVDFLNDLGYATLEAQDARAALTILEDERRIDLLITDVGLPGMNGRQLADVARQHRPDLKVLFATGYAEAATSRSGFLGPGMDMISKPFDMDSLAAKVREMIDAP